MAYGATAADLPALIQAWINKTEAIEGGYSNDPNDAGAETNRGVTVAEARARGYTGAMKDLPKSFADATYRDKYAVSTQFDQMALIDINIAYKLYDAGVNMGPMAIGAFLQRILNGLDYQSALFPKLKVDGNCFAMTRGAFTALIGKRGDEARHVVYGMLLALQSTFYLTLAENKPTQEEFEWGWQETRAVGQSAYQDATA